LDWRGKAAPLLFRNFLVFLDVIDRILDGADFLGIFVGDFQIESFLKCHDQFHLVERVRAQVIDE
jgi:hypothetical protein